MNLKEKITICFEMQMVDETLLVDDLIDEQMQIYEIFLNHFFEDDLIDDNQEKEKQTLLEKIYNID